MEPEGTPGERSEGRVPSIEATKKPVVVCLCGRNAEAKKRANPPVSAMKEKLVFSSTERERQSRKWGGQSPSASEKPSGGNLPGKKQLV